MHMNECPDSCICHVPLFEDLAEHEKLKLYTLTQSRIYEKGEVIYRNGERSEWLYVITQGLVKLSSVSDKGKEQIFRFFFPGDFFGQFALLQDKLHYADASAINRSVIVLIHKHHFKKLITTNPDLTYQFLLMISERLQLADEWIGALNLFEIEQRVAKILLYFHHKSCADDGILDIPKKELAAMIGITPGTLSGKLTQLEKEKVISMSNRKIKIIDPARLEQG